MSEPNIKRASLAEIRKLKEKDKLFRNPDAPDGKSLGPEFWTKAEIEEPRKIRSVHLKLDQEVFNFFHGQSGGRGHLTKMQNVLKAYVKAQSHT